MYFHELRPKTWIQREDKFYFVDQVDEEEVGLFINGIYETFITVDEFPTSYKQLTFPEFNVGDRVIYKKYGKYRIVKILDIDEDVAYQYHIKPEDVYNPVNIWASPTEIYPIDY